jgi:hypothetical protein
MRRRINALLDTLIGMGLCAWTVTALALMGRFANADIVYGGICNVNIPTTYRCIYHTLGTPNSPDYCSGCTNYGVVGVCSSAVVTTCAYDGTTLCPGSYPFGCTCQSDACP